MPGVCLRMDIISFNTSTDRVVEEASGNSNVMYNLPSSSVGMNPVGLWANNPTVPAYTQMRMMRKYGAIAMHFLTPEEYDSVAFLNHSLKLKKNLLSPFKFLFEVIGLRIREHNAGVSDNATNAEIITETAMVIANC